MFLWNDNAMDEDGSCSAADARGVAPGIRYIYFGDGLRFYVFARENVKT